MTNIKFIKQSGHQGDTQWFEIESIPPEAKKINKRFLAASERTGSMHALFGDYDLYEYEDGFIVETKDDCILNHSLQKDIMGLGITMDSAKVTPKKDHRHAEIPGKKIFYVGIHRRADPLTASFKKVID